MITSLATMAEGYQINTLSAKQLGMGHVGVAMKLGSESMIFNPAGLGFSNKTLDISGSFIAIKANASATADGVKYETDNGFSTPMAVSASFKIYDNLQCGLTLYTPYGSSINWGDNWAGAVLSQKVNLKTFTLQPTFAWRITPSLSVGAGLMVSWGNVDLYKGLVSAASLLPLGIDTQGITPASINLNGTADVAVGVNLGVMYDINSQWTVGLNWRSKQMMKVKKGEASVLYAVDGPVKQMLQQSLDNINNTNFSAEMPMPQILQAGVTYKPSRKLTLAFDAQFTGWRTYKSLNIGFDIPKELKAVYDQDIEKNYHNAWCFHLGGQYALTERFDVRAGLMVDTTPCDDEFYNPETPGMTKIEPTVGFSFRPIDRLSIDFAFMYVAGLGKDGASCTYRDILQTSLQQKPVDATFTADYKVNAFVPSIGLSYSF